MYNTNYTLSALHGIVTIYLFVRLFGIADVYTPMYRSEQLDLVKYCGPCYMLAQLPAQPRHSGRDFEGLHGTECGHFHPNLHISFMLQFRMVAPFACHRAWACLPRRHALHPPSITS